MTFICRPAEYRQAHTQIRVKLQSFMLYKISATLWGSDLTLDHYQTPPESFLFPSSSHHRPEPSKTCTAPHASPETKSRKTFWAPTTRKLVRYLAGVCFLLHPPSTHTQRQVRINFNKGRLKCSIPVEVLPFQGLTACSKHPYESWFTNCGTRRDVETNFHSPKK